MVCGPRREEALSCCRSRGPAGRRQLEGRLGFPSSSRNSLPLPAMYSAAVQALCCEGVRGGFSLPSKNKNLLGRHYGKAGHQEPGVIRGHRVLCVIQEGFLAKGAVELPSENRQGSGLGEGIGLRAWRGDRRKRPQVHPAFSPSGCLSLFRVPCGTGCFRAYWCWGHMAG